VGCGPTAKPVLVSSAVLPASGEANHLEGLGVGILDVSGAVNTRDLQPFLQNGTFDPGHIDAGSRALVTVFQTWLGVGDTQVMIQLTSGRVMSVDHGDALGNTSALTDPTPIALEIQGVDPTVGKNPQDIRHAVRTMESLTDGELLDSVACVPSGDPAWQAEPTRRLEIARWLAHRRDKVREVMERWLSN